ncbi:MAG: hypothetical protein COA69_08720 [Robiginitomaculum sp.]|nr:MAG: hypothetical protein COA69_08720 [Robiginitomaculum sp.]
MAEFGPEIFHALAYMVNKDQNMQFETETNPEAVGFSADGIEDGKPMYETLDRMRNQIFMMFMLRARNALYALQARGIPSKDVKNVKIDMSILFHDSIIHDSLELAPPIELSAYEGTEFSDFNSVLIDYNLPPGGNIGRIQGHELDGMATDSVAAYHRGSKVMAFCGGREKIDAAQAGNDFYKKIIDLR